MPASPRGAAGGRNNPNKPQSKSGVPLWAYTKVGKSSKGKTVYRWVKVGSPLWKQLGHEGMAYKRGGLRPTKPPKNFGPSASPLRSPDATDRGTRSPKQQKKDQKVANRTAKQAASGNLPFQKKARRNRNKGGGGGGAKSTATFNQVGQRIGSTNVGSKLPMNADDIAGMQFDPAIRDLKVLIERLGPQNAQQIADIGNWYGDVQGLNQQAGERNVALSGQVAGQNDAAAQQLLAAIGGGANQGAGMVAGAAQGGSDLMRAIGSIQGMYHNDMSPILEQAGADQKSRQQRMNTQQMQDYQLQLADLLGQRGQAKSAASMDISKYNNSVAQQWFQNKLASMEAATAASMSGLELKAKKAALKAQQSEAQKASGAFIPWGKLGSEGRYNLIQSAVYKPNGKARSYQQARNYLVGQSYAAGNQSPNKGILQMLQSFYR